MTIALIGAGQWGKNLAATLKDLGALAAVAEQSPALRAQLAAQFPDVPVVEDYRAVLATDIPAVAIATPVPSHFAIARDALFAGKDVFVEKPMTLSHAEAEELVALAEREERILMVGHLLLYQPAVQWLKRYLDSGALGRLISLHQERLNLGRARTVENSLWSFGVHDLAVLLHLVDAPPARLRVSGQAALTPGVEDDVHLHLAFENGVTAHLHTSWLWPEKRRRLTVVGSAGMVIYDEGDQRVVLHRKHIGSDLVAKDEGSEVLYQGHGEPLRLELAHFLERLADRQTPLSDGRNGAGVIRVLEAASRGLEDSHEPLLRSPERLHR